MKERYCRTVKSGHVCGKRLDVSRYFNCKDCVPELDTESEWDAFDDMNVEGESDNGSSAPAAAVAA